MSELEPTHERVLTAGDGQRIHGRTLGDGVARGGPPVQRPRHAHQGLVPVPAEASSGSSTRCTTIRARATRRMRAGPIPPSPAMAGDLAVILDELGIARVHADGHRHPEASSPRSSRGCNP